MTEENHGEIPKMYYGAHEIVNVEELENGKQRVEVKFATPKPVSSDPADGTDVGEKFVIPNWELAACSATEPCREDEHYTELRNRRANYVVQKMLEMLIDLDTRVEDIQFYMRKMLESMQLSEERAINLAFEVSDKDDIRFSDWERKVKK